MSEPRVAVIGASGFLGQRVRTALLARGAAVDSIVAPRLSTRARDVKAIDSAVSVLGASAFGEMFATADTVVNAAGLADAAGSLQDELFGANALLPALIAAAKRPGQRLVHVSSAAVQGSTELDESRRYAPFSPYSASKVAGEQVLMDAPRTVVFRPTSIHGPERSVTGALYRTLASPLSFVADSGDGHTPQALVQNVAAALAEVALMPQEPPAIVLQPSEGLTCLDLALLLGGRVPRSLPSAVARTLVRTGFTAGRRSPWVLANTRRAEMLWFGQGQASSWLTARGWSPPVGRPGWVELRRDLAGQRAVANRKWE